MTKPKYGTRDYTWAAQPRQDLFLRVYEHIFEIFYGGSAGGGKTDSALMFQQKRRAKFPGSNGVIFRRKFTDLNKSGAAIPRFQQLFAQYGVKYNANEHKAYWPNGSVTEFAYCDSDSDLQNYQGAQYDDITVDELTQWPEDLYLYLFSRARITDEALFDMGLEARVRAMGNPGGIGHAWVKKRFIDVCRETPLVDPETGLTRLFIPSSIYDNEALMRTSPAYVAFLKSLPEKERRQLLEGDWNVFDGQVFDEWRDHIHVIQPMTPPRHWRRWAGFDWGYTAPWVLNCFAQEPGTGQVVLYKELVGRKMDDARIAQTILDHTKGETLDAIYADPSIWTQKNGVSTADIMQDRPGWTIPLMPADNDREGGVRMLHNYLAWKPDARGNAAVSPMLVVGRNCRYFIASVPNLVHSQTKPEDVDTKGDDHSYDAARYGLMSCPLITYGSDGMGTMVLLNRAA